MPDRVLTMAAADHAWSGKLPCRGDFLEGGDRELLTWMQDWAAEGMVAIRQGGGPAADAFMTVPIQRFVGTKLSLTADALIGVLGPGMDRAGRLYPFALARRLQGDAGAQHTWMGNDAWFARAEAVYLTCLAADFDPDRLDGLMEDLQSPAPEPVAGGETGQVAFGVMGGSVRVTEGCPPFASIFGPSPTRTADMLAG
jgi:type VI secretion system protein ImpM